jgi:hypothetical protein
MEIHIANELIVPMFQIYKSRKLKQNICLFFIAPIWEWGYLGGAGEGWVQSSMLGAQL